MTDKTPEHGGATEEQIEAAARAFMLEYHGRDLWDELEDDDELTPRTNTLRAIRAALSASASAHPADEHRDAEEREADHRGVRWDEFGELVCPGCGHLYATSEQRRDGTYGDGLTDKVQSHQAEREAESEDHAATVTGDREKLIAEAREKVVEYLRTQNVFTGETSTKVAEEQTRKIFVILAALAAPVEVDAEALREARAETWDDAIAAVHAWWSMPPEKRPAVIVNPYGVALRGEGR